MRHYSPLPRINPSSPSLQSHGEGGSPTATFLTDSYRHHRQQQQQPYADSRRQQQQQNPPYPDPRDSPDTNHHGYPSRSKPKEQGRERDGVQEEEEGKGEEEEEQEGVLAAGEEEEGYPPHSHRSYKETAPQTSPRREAEERGRGRDAQSRPPPPASPPDAHRARGENSEPPDRVPPPPLDRGSPRHSPEPSPVRKAAAAQAYKGANGYERDAAYTNNTNEDSGFAGLTPEDQYKNRDKENYYDGLNR